MSKLDEVYEEYLKARNKHMKEGQALKNIESKLQELLIDECVENIMDFYDENDTISEFNVKLMIQDTMSKIKGMS